MESIFHEKQEGSLCAQHCLNNLLQGEYFSPVELSSIAHQLDEEERMRMAEGGVTSEDYRTFLQQPSGNMDDSGFFSIQWFNLNSLLTGPELISDTYLALFLAQLQQEGYSIFVVKGDLPDCEADQLLQMIRVQQMHRPKLIGEELAQLKEQRVQKTDLEHVLEVNDGTGMLDEDEEELQRALALSRQEIDMEDEEADLRRAIQLSMQGTSRNRCQDIPQTSGSHPTSEELRKRREAYFEKQQQQQQQPAPPGQLTHLCEKSSTSCEAPDRDLGDSMSEEDMLQAAVTMSLETVRSKTEGKK
ncbi:ataxin-3 isoform X9 [Bos indicus]|uniref:ubiquitinyl hydrolase 1 n=1 Tax=Bos indicus TaxID=9915 RepID=A0A6P5DLX4_BOSIN|nr:PREDICTED: ataxin-3 isoform X2 [Bos indicus]XP_027376859.1 ataxin-3 isoform X2 [Bos indicus x Bos taurus]XP_059735195.1 ataxin-3 isoform X10 [Bos taurus]